MRKKGIPEVLVRSVMRLYEGAKLKISMDSELSVVNVGICKGSLSSPFFVVLVDVPNLARQNVLSELLFVGDLGLMSETIEGLGNKFIKWKDAFDSTSLKVNLGKTTLMVSGGFAKDGLSKKTSIHVGSAA